MTHKPEPPPHVQYLADILEGRNEIEEDVWKIKCLIDNLKAKAAYRAIDDVHEYAAIARKREAA